MKKSRQQEYGTRNRAALIISGRDYFDRMEAMIDGARTLIHLQVYIIADDTTGTRISSALLRAAQRGVVVFLIADGYASRQLPTTFINAFREAGGHFRWFEPLYRSKRFYIGRRMHHKVLVVDHRHALVSGRNIADRYNDLEGRPAWYDMALEVEGEAALDLSDLCCDVWNGTLPSSHRTRALPPTSAERAAVLANWPKEQHCNIRVRLNDWLYGRAEVTASYLELFRSAEKEVLLAASYFVPGRVLKRAIANAARRGVRITLITTGPSDVLLSKPAERYFYAWLLRHGIALFEYQRNVLHAKVATRDDAWCTLGSFNMNDLSMYTTLEANLDVEDAGIARAVRTEQERVMREECRAITAAEVRRTGLLPRFGQWCAFQLLRLSNSVVTFYYRRER